MPEKQKNECTTYTLYVRARQQVAKLLRVFSPLQENTKSNFLNPNKFSNDIDRFYKKNFCANIENLQLNKYSRIIMKFP